MSQSALALGISCFIYCTFQEQDACLVWGHMEHEKIWHLKLKNYSGS